MIITKTAFSDVVFLVAELIWKFFFQKYGGAVLSTTIDKYCYVNVRHLPPFF